MIVYPTYPGGHAAYRNFVVEQLRKHYPEANSLPDRVLKIAERFWNKDLTGVDTLMRDCYSKFGPPAQTCVLYAALLSAVHRSESSSHYRVGGAAAACSGLRNHQRI